MLRLATTAQTARRLLACAPALASAARAQTGAATMQRGASDPQAALERAQADAASALASAGGGTGAGAREPQTAVGTGSGDKLDLRMQPLPQEVFNTLADAEMGELVRAALAAGARTRKRAVCGAHAPAPPLRHCSNTCCALCCLRSGPASSGGCARPRARCAATQAAAAGAAVQAAHTGAAVPALACGLLPSPRWG